MPVKNDVAAARNFLEFHFNDTRKILGDKLKFIHLILVWADLDAEGTGREKKAEYKTIKDALAALGKFEYPVGFEPTTCSWPCAIKLAEKRAEGEK